MKKLNLVIGILIGIMILSCSNDDDETQVAENELIGIWLRIDSNDTFEERYTFNSNQTLPHVLKPKFLQTHNN